MGIISNWLRRPDESDEKIREWRAYELRQEFLGTAVTLALGGFALLGLHCMNHLPVGDTDAVSYMEADPPSYAMETNG